MSLDRVHPEALAAVSQLGLATGAFDQSLDATERLLVLDPNDVNALIVRGLLDLARRRYEEAIAYADRALEVAPGEENASVLRARAAFLLDEPQTALAVLDAAVADGPVTASIALTRLEIYRELSDADGMARQFAALRNLQPDDVGLQIDEANFWFKRGDAAQAVGLIIRALGEVEEDSRQETELGRQIVRLFDEFGHASFSEAQWRRFIEEAPPEVAKATARYLILAGDHTRAQAVIAGLPETERLALASQLAASRGNTDRALAGARRVLARDESQCDALTALSLALLLEGEHEGAVRAGQRAASECPDVANNHIAAAKAYDAWERRAAVRRIYGQAIDQQPQNLALFRHYADWLERNDQLRRAVAVMRRYTRDSPASIAGLEAYREICARAGAGCEREARLALDRARTRYGLDLEPGQLQPNGLFGRLVGR
jgi:tetratricopeptide (TPR) repeat protein